MRSARRVLAGVVAVGALLFAAPGALAASTLWVSANGTNTTGCTHAAPCASFYQALGLATAGSTIELGPGRWGANLSIPGQAPSPLTIVGAGASATTIDGEASVPVFALNGATLTLRNLTVTGGASRGSGGAVDAVGGSVVTLAGDDIVGNFATASGGGVYVDASTLTITNSSIYDNQTTGGANDLGGGGVAIDSGSSAKILDSTIAGNSVTGSAAGGGIADAAGSTLANDTIAQNTSAGGGGGLALLSSSSGATLAGLTIADNGGGGIFTSSPASSGQDVLLARNTPLNCAGGLIAKSSLEDDPGATCGFTTASGDVVGVSAGLSPELQNNGGPTATLSLLPGSPAVGAGSCKLVDSIVGADVDQRGMPRYFAQRHACDIGAWDSGGSQLELVAPASVPAGVVGGSYSLPLQAINGVPSYTWSVASGSLPAGLSLSATSGAISGTPSKSGTFSFTVEVTDAAKTPHVATLSLSVQVYPKPKPAVWLASLNADDLFTFPPGSASAAGTELGAMGVDGPDGVAVDQYGYVYAANANAPSITVFAPGSGPNPAPARTIEGGNTGLYGPAGIALDTSRGLLYVANPGANTITVYHTTDSGNVFPVHTIRYGSIDLDAPWGVTVDANGNLWVANAGSHNLAEFAPGADGYAQPETVIDSDSLDDPHGLGQDANGDLLVANYGANDVLEFDAGQLTATGTVTPAATVYDTSGELDEPQGIDVDAAGLWYVAGASGLTVFNPGSSTPLRNQPVVDGADAVAVAPPLSITTSRMPVAALGRRYRQAIGTVLGRAPLHWRLVRGKLPRGLKLTRRGLIEGVARQLGTFHFTVSVRDSTHPAMSARQRITLVVHRAPTITAVHAASGPLRGGQRVTITGSGFAVGRRRTIITFGRLNAIDVVCRTSTRCTARTPPHATGTVRVSVTVDGLTATGGRATRYRYRRG